MAKGKKDEISGLLIPAGLFIGMGFGFLYNQLVVGICLGLGIGFVGTFIGKIILKDSKKFK